MIDLSGKNILIIGASSGIGEEVAYTTSIQGANVILVARRKEKLHNVIEKINSHKKACYVFDVSDIDGINSMIKTIVSEQGKLDGMVYTAGISDGDVPLKYLNNKRLLDTFTTNYFGFVECVRQVTMKNMYNDGLRIVAVSSNAARFGDKAHIAYSASKAAMDASVRCMAKELSNKHVYLNSVAPSMVKTQMYIDYLKMNGYEEESDSSLSNRQYLGIIEPKDVAYAITFLLSEEARMITGVTMPVDGGFSTSC